MTEPDHFRWTVEDRVATITFDRPERKNALTFESYRELRDTLRALSSNREIRVVIMTGSGGNFCSGGDVREIIGPLTERTREGLLEFTTMTGDVVRAMRTAPQVVISAIEGVCVGAGACLALASDFRIGTPGSRIAFLFVRVALCAADMGAATLLPRVIGHGRATDLLITGREVRGEEALSVGFLSRLVPDGESLATAQTLAEELATGPARAYAETKSMLDREVVLTLDEALDLEAEVQAELMESSDFREAYAAFIERRRPVFRGA